MFNIDITKKAEIFLKKLNIQINKCIYIYIIYPNTKYVSVNITYCRDKDLNIKDFKLKTDLVSIFINFKSLNFLKNSIIDVINNNVYIKKKRIYLNVLKYKINNLFKYKINIMLKKHNGFIELIDVKNHILIVKFGGGCVGCSTVHNTLNSYVFGIIKKKFPEINHIKDITNHNFY